MILNIMQKTHDRGVLARKLYQKLFKRDKIKIGNIAILSDTYS